MSEDLKKTGSVGHEKMSQEQHAKIIEVREMIGTLSEKETVYCTDASISRYLKSQNWNVKKASQMLKQSLKWRREYKPEEIRWDDVSNEAKIGKMYRANYCDKHGRPVIIMKTNRQNSKSLTEEIKHFVYCMENAVLNLPPLQEQRLGLAIMYDAPGIFQPFFAMVKVLLESESYKKVKFVYPNDQNTKKIMESLFNMDQLEPAFGGNDDTEFDMNKYAKRMKEEDNKMHSFWTSHNIPSSDSTGSEADSDASNNEKTLGSSLPNPEKSLEV
ncbi:unnamed protein product [Vicia faba]|uniref:CRAL-TRIO domain-containing protein n=1 Tax=Vicia faba TaxID=3906 RepID=A0AAV0ZGG8_VICFA|nr:unnamed protein product [Vicia faba]